MTIASLGAQPYVCASRHERWYALLTCRSLWMLRAASHTQRRRTNTRTMAPARLCNASAHVRVRMAATGGAQERGEEATGAWEAAVRRT